MCLDAVVTTTPQEAAMVHRLRSAIVSEGERPISFILGAGISDGAAPSTKRMVELFQRSMSPDPEDQRDLEELLAQTQPRDHYQAAAQFVIERAGISRLNRIVRLAVLTARSPRIPPDVASKYLDDSAQLEQLDSDWRGWLIPRGLAALGRLVELVPHESRGPILTTNFDPLIESSLRAAGLVPHLICADVDGAIPTTPSLPNVVSVNHLHGYWNQGDTLHTGAQLTRSRPRLLGSLRQVLTRTTCVVLGYGGWDDLLTESIWRLVEEGAERDIEILWGCHGATAQLGRLTDKALPGRLQPYVDVDANSLLPAVETAVRDRLRPGSRKPTSGRPGRPPVPAFEDIDSDFIKSHISRDTSPISAISYFDGRSPTWVDALGDRAPRLDLTQEIDGILQAQTGQHIAYLLSGPTGEGKSTMLRQIAGRLSEDPGNRVLWMSAAGGFEPHDVTNIALTSSRVWIAIDDADIFAKRIASAVGELDRVGRTDIRLVLAARDGDWARAVQMESASIPSRVLRVFEVGGITRSDAKQITRAWGKFGDRALGKLHSLAPADRAAALFGASEGSSEGALLGAMLETRYGNDFRQHIWELMKRLSHVRLPGGRNLLEAYGAICLVYSHGISRLPLAYLGEWLGMSETEVDGLVVYRLGREAAAVRHGDSIVPRHRRIAKEAVALLSEFGISEIDLMREVVASVVRVARGSRWDDDVLSVVYAGQNLESKSLAIAAADGAVHGDDRQLRLVNYRVGVYRDFDEVDDALLISEAAWKSIDRFDDLRLTLRKFLLTWARVAGRAGRYRDSAALNACALLDIPDMGALTPDEATRALSGIAWSLGMLPEANRHITGRGACAESALYLAPSAELREQATRYLSEASRDGYAELDAAKQRGAIVATIKESLKSSRIGPARHYEAHAAKVQQLLSVAQL